MAGVTADGRKPRNIKAHNLRYVLSLLREHGNYTVSEISRESNLRVTTVIKIIDKLKQSGIVVSLGKGISTREGGKKPEVFAFNKQYKYAITIYMGQQAAKYQNIFLQILAVMRSEWKAYLIVTLKVLKAVSRKQSWRCGLWLKLME